MTGKPTFETIVSAHGATVLRVCRSVVGAADAEDVWSDTFLAAMRAYPDLPPDANVEAWLVTIAHRKAIDITRKRARRATPVAAPRETAMATTDDRSDSNDDLVHAVRHLPPKQRQAVAYHYLGGLPYTEVAAIIGGNTAAARRAAADGISHLRRTFEASHPKGIPSEHRC
jgi:RNA polymerase sigma factor (sigma-70 family)